MPRTERYGGPWIAPSSLACMAASFVQFLPERDPLRDGRFAGDRPKTGDVGVFDLAAHPAGFDNADLQAAGATGRRLRRRGRVPARFGGVGSIGFHRMELGGKGCSSPVGRTSPSP